MLSWPSTLTLPSPTGVQRKKRSPRLTGPQPPDCSGRETMHQERTVNCHLPRGPEDLPEHGAKRLDQTSAWLPPILICVPKDDPSPCVPKSDPSPCAESLLKKPQFCQNHKICFAAKLFSVIFHLSLALFRSPKSSLAPFRSPLCSPLSPC